eukprot:GFUD01139825.1.p1 GENE.GFUD01139825.1~~GFUD01139825.1.p1  ORF type:complete len:113 (+),score=24.07 GFUD01139825.1:2-340(+)
MHMKTHQEKSFKCSKCDQSFDGLKLLSKHKNQEHMKVKREESLPTTTFCDKCEVTFSSRQALKYHIIVVHTKAYPGLCDGCGKGFTNTGLGERLEKHKKTCLALAALIEYKL